MKIRSLAESDAQYLIVQVRPIAHNCFHVQILAPNAEGKNREYGFAFDIKVPEVVWQTVKSILKQEE